MTILITVTVAIQLVVMRLYSVSAAMVEIVEYEPNTYSYNDKKKYNDISVLYVSLPKS